MITNIDCAMDDAANEIKSASPRGLADKYLDDYHARGTLRRWRSEWWIYSDALGWRVTSSKALRAEIADKAKDWWFIHTRANGKEERRQVYPLLRNRLLSDVEGQLMQPGRTMIAPVIVALDKKEITI
jgi:hypothetical protein